MTNKEDKLGALWVKESKSGTKFLTGKVGDTDIVVFQNNFKNSDKMPDYIIYKSKPRDNTAQQKHEPTAKALPTNVVTNVKVEPPSFDTDDLPF